MYTKDESIIGHIQEQEEAAFEEEEMMGNWPAFKWD